MDMNELEIISYAQATTMLEVTRQTLHNATSRGVLTPLPRRARKPGHLVKKQVELFIGKDLSLKWLTPEEAVLWQEIKNAITAKKTPDSAKNELAFEQVQDKIKFFGSLMEGTADIALEVIDGIIQAVQTESFTPDVVVNHVKQSPSFQRIMALLGVNMNAVPDETLQAINDMAYEVAERVQAKLIAMMFRYATREATEKAQALLIAPSQEHQDTEHQDAKAS